MNREQQRIAIAAHLGHKTLPKHGMVGRDENRYFQCQLCGITQGWHEWNKSKKDPEGPCANTLNEYLDDLNVMREAEATLREDQYPLYVEYLLAYVPEETCDLNPDAAQFHIAHSTAAQRAEAFLRTVGKWELLVVKG